MGYFDEELRPKITIPKISKALERQIGSFFVAWSVLENELDIAYPVIFRVDPTLAVNLYANIGTQGKLDTLNAAIDSLSLVLDEKRVKSAQSVLARIRTLNEKARNTLAHCRIMPFFHNDQQRPMWKIVRYSVRKEHYWIFHPNSVTHWKRMTKAVLAVAGAWHSQMRILHNHLKKFSDEEIGDNLQVREKDAPLVELRRRNTPPLKKGGSRHHQPKPGTPE